MSNLQHRLALLLAAESERALTAEERLEQMTRERDEARAMADQMYQGIYSTRKRSQKDPREEITDDPTYLLASMFYDIIDGRDAYRRGAEDMRNAAANALDGAIHECEHRGRFVRALPIPEEP